MRGSKGRLMHQCRVRVIRDLFSNADAAVAAATAAAHSTAANLAAQISHPCSGLIPTVLQLIYAIRHYLRPHELGEISLAAAIAFVP